ncbi:MAG: ABC transporter permease [Candidatus Thioglobus sp. MED-G25]|jgi:peptide/nickel transport system permease protein|nr:ABC transporter permease [Gammaproteobacteria bacterium]PDH39560.1 MAG: ABC transporter permease [Candidatus Thioglobus sp. MED-G25]
MQFFIATVKRAGFGLVLLVAVLALNFVLMHIAPGDVADTIAQDAGGLDAEVMEQIRIDYGLDLPLWQQMAKYFWGVAQLDLGYSFYYNEPVTKLILEKLPATLLLVISAQVLSIFLGVMLGVMAARKPTGMTSHFVTVLSLVGYAAPVFWTGIMLIILFAVMVPIFPIGSMVDVSVEREGIAYAMDVLRHLVLPAVTLGSIFLALYSRLSRASMLDVLGSDYVRTAQAKGLSEFQVVYKHALRNALLPVVTTVGLVMSGIVSGAVLVETVFSWPGLGTLAVQSIIARDTPTILGILFFSSLVVVVANLLTDMVYRIIDPRIKTSGGSNL